MTTNVRHRVRGRTRLKAASKARSAVPSLGRATWRPSTWSWWRSTRISTSFQCSERKRSASSSSRRRSAQQGNEQRHVQTALRFVSAQPTGLQSAAAPRRGASRERVGYARPIGVSGTHRIMSAASQPFRLRRRRGLSARSAELRPISPQVSFSHVGTFVVSCGVILGRRGGDVLKLQLRFLQAMHSEIAATRFATRGSCMSDDT
jgi:hypothetical protein